MVRESLRFDDESTDCGEPCLNFKVTAECEFQNNTDQAVTILIAFPLPDDVCPAADSPYRRFDESQFQVWVEGQKIKYAMEARAFQADGYIQTSTKNLGKDYTGLLREFGIAPESCNMNETVSQERREKLVTLGLFDKETNVANWTLRRKYYWTQTFQANRSTHIKIEYPAQVGISAVQEKQPLWKDEMNQTCGSAAMQEKIAAEMPQPGGFVQVVSVDFILVTANYWNGPIKDFRLTVNTSQPHVSFCWDGPIKRLDAMHIEATAHDFSPKRDLLIGFFDSGN
jgi:Domain of unknown function (DUF4424)